MTATDAATPAFRQFSNPATGESIQFITTPQDANEDVLRLNWRSMPGGAITEHIHPHQQERFTITAGEAHFTVNGEEQVVRAGETLDVPAGVRHSESNPGSVEVTGVIELRPALGMKELLKARPRPAVRRRTRCNLAPPSGSSVTRAARPHHRSGCRT